MNDYAFGAGFEGDLTDSVKMDVSYVVGGNTFAFEITDSQNASWVRCRAGEKEDKSRVHTRMWITAGSMPGLSAEAGELEAFSAHC